MKKTLVLSFAAFAALSKINAQTKFGDNKATINGSSVVEMESTNKGLLLPRVNLTSTTTWGLATATPENGMMVYNKNAAMTGTTAAPILAGAIGMYYWDGARWVGMNGQQKATADSTYWALKGNGGTTPPTKVGTAVGSANFWGTTDAKNLAVATNGITRAIFDQNGSLYGGNNTFDAALNPVSSIVWGEGNRDSAGYSLLIGANNKLAPAAAASLISGLDNKSAGAFSTVFGYNNSDSAKYTLIVGEGNTIGNNAHGSAIIGPGNKIPTNADVNFILGGYNTLLNPANSPQAQFSYNLVSGNNNKLTTTPGIITVDGNAVSGDNNLVGAFGSVVGGSNNKVMPSSTAQPVTVAVFGANNVDSSSRTLVAGSGNAIHLGAEGSVVTGQNNTIVSGTNASVSGMNNKLFDANNALVSGSGNIDSAWSTFMSGAANQIWRTGTYSAVFGSLNKVRGNGNFVIGSGNETIAFSTLQNIPPTYNFVSGGSNKIYGSTGYRYNGVFGEKNTINVLPALQASGNLIAGTSNTLDGSATSNNNFISGSTNTITGVSNATVMGLGNKALGTMWNGFVVGQYNQTYNNPSGANALFVVGNGTSDAARSNAFMVTNAQTTGAATNGLIITAAPLPKYATEAAATADASLPAGAFYKIGGAVYQKD